MRGREERLITDRASALQAEGRGKLGSRFLKEGKTTPKQMGNDK